MTVCGMSKSVYSVLDFEKSVCIALKMSRAAPCRRASFACLLHEDFF